jgi:hypothetical protein
VTGTRATLLLCLACAAVTSLGLTGLVHGAETTLSVLESLPIHKSDANEPPDERAARLRKIALAIDGAAEAREVRAMLLAVGKHESHFARSVCGGSKTGDDGKAFGCWQSWELDRSGGIVGQAKRAADHLRKAGNYCVARGHHRVAGSLSLYATGRTCTFPLKDRFADYQRYVSKL